MLRRGWSRFQRDPLGRRWCAWVWPEGNATVRHCGHPTALRPYYVTIAGHVLERKFARLEQAMIAAEEAVSEAGARLSSEVAARSHHP